MILALPRVKTFLGLSGLVMVVTAGLTNINVRLDALLSNSSNGLSVIVFENGRSGFLGEHSCMDGTPTLRMNEFILAALAAGKIDLGSPIPSKSLPTPKEITFGLAPVNQTDIIASEAAFDKLVGAHDLHVLQFDAYGKEYIKKFKASPDAWVQLVKQLAFWKLKERPGVTYESTQTRKFQLGRTEVTRSASNESKEWVAAMVDPNASVCLIIILAALISANPADFAFFCASTSYSTPTCYNKFLDRTGFCFYSCTFISRTHNGAHYFVELSLVMYSMLHGQQMGKV
jgi:hypothetical protein